MCVLKKLQYNCDQCIDPPPGLTSFIIFTLWDFYNLVLQKQKPKKITEDYFVYKF